LDAYYLTRPALKTWKALKAQFGCVPVIITKAKLSAKAYRKPNPHNGRGAPRKKGEKVKLKTFFKRFPVILYKLICLFTANVRLCLTFAWICFGEMVSISHCALFWLNSKILILF